MNYDIWSQHTAKQWARIIATMRDCEVKARKSNLKYQWVAFFYMLMALGDVCIDWHWTALFTVLIGWLMYRLSVLSLRRAACWRVCIHHAERMLHETWERAQWHEQQLDGMLSRMEAALGWLDWFNLKRKHEDQRTDGTDESPSDSRQPG